MVGHHYNFFYLHPACVFRRYKTLQTAPSPFQCNEPSPVPCSEPGVLHLRMTCACEVEEEKEAAATSLAHLPVTPTEQHNPGNITCSFPPPGLWPLHGGPCSRTCHPQGKQKSRELDHTQECFQLIHTPLAPAPLSSNPSKYVLMKLAWLLIHLIVKACGTRTVIIHCY